MGDRCIDEKAIKALLDLGGASFVVQMIDLFLAYAPKVIAEARGGLARGDLEPVVRMGHSLRSSGRNLGVMKIVELAGAIEVAGRGKEIIRLPALIEGIEQAYTEARLDLETEKAKFMSAS